MFDIGDMLAGKMLIYTSKPRFFRLPISIQPVRIIH